MPPFLFFGVPDAPPRFLGRDGLIERMAARLASSASLTLAAVGPGGVGKTSLAAAMAHDPAVQARFADGVLWAALGASPDPAGALNAWAGALGLRVTGLPDLADRAAALREAIGFRRMLLVIDDVWEEDAAWLLQCGGPLCSYLFTTRSEAVARRLAGGRGVEVIPVLDADASLALLARWAPRACAADPENARALTAAVQGLPLALEVLGGYLASSDDAARLRQAAAWLASPPPPDPEPARLPDVLAVLRRAAAVLGLAPEGDAAAPAASEPPSPLETVVRLSLHELPPDYALAFYELGAFAPKPETFDALAAEHVAGTGAAELLAARGLVEHAGEGTFALHPAVAEVARARVPADATTRHRLHYLLQVRDAGDVWRAVERVYGQVTWAWEHLAPGQEKERLQLARMLGTYQRLRGLGRDAVAWGEAATRTPPPRGRMGAYADVLYTLAWVYDDLGLDDRSLAIYERCLELHRKARNDGAIAAVLNNVGMVYSRLGDWETALAYHERARGFREKVDDPAGMAVTLSNIAGIYERQGRRHEALEHYLRVVPLLEAEGEWPGLGITLNNLGLLYSNLDETQQALETYTRAVRILEEAGDRANLALTLWNLAVQYHEMDRLEAALDHYARALAIREETGDYRGCVRVLRAMANVYEQLGDHDKQVDCLRRVKPLMRELRHRLVDA